MKGCEHVAINTCHFIALISLFAQASGAVCINVALRHVGEFHQLHCVCVNVLCG